MISVLLLTHNEEENVGFCLDSIAWCDDVTVIDSFSTDRTEEICRRPNVRWVQRSFEGWAAQRQWALDNLDFAHEWVLSLDADEVVTEAMRDEILEKTQGSEHAAFEMRFRLILWGQWVRRSDHYPVWITRLYRKDRIQYVESGASDVAQIDGTVGRLDEDLVHESHKVVDDWLAKHVVYARREASQSVRRDPFSLDRLRNAETQIARRQELKKLWHYFPFKGLGYFLFQFVVKGGFLDGRAGFRLCFMRASYWYWIHVMIDEERRHGLKRPSR